MLGIVVALTGCSSAAPDAGAGSEQQGAAAQDQREAPGSQPAPGASAQDAAGSDEAVEDRRQEGDAGMGTVEAQGAEMTIEVNGTVLRATLADNSSADALRAVLGEGAVTATFSLA